ncbi:sigma-70 family RNA polymerase sigma factor [Singulisphaera sp. GP187]|uniref:sigma-70 family RNA polymerase sigma factor n=1 Tax=Singulisphaera sp. GP187 TaxID=1882752 RepID=UPI0009F85DA3|nr:sigma-70 family RNA polymerase sigma factor [Singulisphaera sp. GP187]
MATRRKNSVLGPLRSLFNVGTIGDMTDGQLLERFAIGGEAGELAFAALVERHGAVVLQICRAILRDEHEAEDAFQATFLVLVRKAGSLWVRDSLGPWLHQVAYRAARCSRSAIVRRTARERRTVEVIAARRDPGCADDGEELRAAIHEEIERMPERYRVLVLLCDLEGRTHEQAARHLGCPVGTVKSRLSRGRTRLRDRLIRRGLIVPAGSFVAGILPRTSRAIPPVSWSDATTRAAIQIAAGQPLTSVISPTVLAVMKHVSRGSFMNSLKGAVLAAVTFGALAAGAVGLAWAGLGEPTGDPQDPSRPSVALPAAGGEKPRLEEPKVRDTADIRGSWEVVYVTGTVVSGNREGYTMPGQIVLVTDKTINLPTLTGNSEAPIKSLDALSYTLEPGRKEADEQVESAEEKFKGFRLALSRMEQLVRKKRLPESSLIMPKKQVDHAEAVLRNTERRRDERQAETTAQESQIDIEAAPGGGTVWRGIYRLKGGILTICYDSGGGRPETFAGNKPSERLIILIQRPAMIGVTLRDRELTLPARRSGERNLPRGQRPLASQASGERELPVFLK